jgi:putative membrane protein
MSRSIKDYLILALKGIAIGTAEFIPGVSGATVAFISGIYIEIIDSIRLLNFKSFKVLINKGFKEFWSTINGNFMLSLTIGIFVSFFTLVGLFSYLLSTFPIFVWSFFFGLVFASSIYMLRDIKEWNYKSIIAIVVGIGFAYGLTLITPASATKESQYWLVFLTAIVAIVAIYLPGISIAFIMLLLGQYDFIIDVFANGKLDFILIFAIGILVGLITFSNLISLLVKKFRLTIVALLTGFLIGSLINLWPWKHTLLSHTNNFAQIIPIKQEIVLPDSYFNLTARDPQTLNAILMAITGSLVIYLLYNSFNRIKQKSEEL